MATVVLLDQEGSRELGLEDVLGKLDDDLGDRLVWIELDRGDRDGLRRVADALELEDATRESLTEDSGRAEVSDFRRYLHVTVLVPDDAEGELLKIDCVVGESALVLIGPGEADALGEFRERVTGHGQLGELDAPSFLAVLLEWAIEGYLTAFDAVEEELEDVDVAAMKAVDKEVGAALQRLVELRRRTGRLRRALGDHRRVVAALAHPELDAISTEESAERFTRVADRLRDALDSAEAARESVRGSFEIVIARSGQRSNDIMKVLTLASVLLLPAAALAGVMGMNFKVGLFESDWLFWVLIGVMLLIAGVTLVTARSKRWI